MSSRLPWDASNHRQTNTDGMKEVSWSTCHAFASERLTSMMLCSVGADERKRQVIVRMSVGHDRVQDALPSTRHRTKKIGAKLFAREVNVGNKQTARSIVPP